MPRELNIVVKVDQVTAKAALKEVEGGIDAVTASAQKQEQAMQAALGVLTAQNLRQFVGDLKAAASEFVNAFAEQERATKSLTAALQAAGSFTPELGRQYDVLATHFENTTVFSDELILSMESLLTQVGGVGPAQMEKALKASTDLASGLGIDLRTATILVAKAFEGHTETLGRYGIILDETKLKADPMRAVLEGINEKFGGQAAGQLDTYSGKMAQLGNRFNNTQESIGQLLTTGLTPLLNAFGFLEPSVQTTALTIGGLVKALAPAALSFATLAPAIAVLATSNLPLLTAALGTTGAALAAIGPAAAVVAMGFAAWEIGRWIGDVSGLTDAVEGFTAKLLTSNDTEVDAAIAARHHREEMEKLAPAIEKANRQLPGWTVNLKDARMSLEDATRAGEEQTEQVKKHIEAVQAAAVKEASALRDTTKLWDEYNALRVEHGGTANAIAIAQIDQWAADLTAQMIKAGTATKEFYAALAIDSHEKMAAVGIDWDVFRTKSIPALMETAANARATYNEMVHSGQFFRSELDAQLAKVHAAEDAMRGYGATAVAAETAAATAAKQHADELAKVKEAANAAAAAMRAMGNSLDVGHAARDPEIMRLLKMGWSLENAEAIKFAQQWHFTAQTYSPRGDPETTPDPSERVPGYVNGVTNAPGGWARVGERGPELVRLPRGADVIPNGGMGATIVNHITIDARESVFDSASGIQRLADKVATALVTQRLSYGVGLP